MDTATHYHMDKLWAKLVAHYAQHRCLKCGQVGDDAHHWFYSRSIHKHRWNINNGVFLCRICHQEAERDREGMFKVVEKNAPTKWAWSQKLPPLRSEPINPMAIRCLYASLKRTAVELGVIAKKPINVSKLICRFPK